MRFCSFALAVGGVDIDDHGQIIAAPWTIVARIGP
jgi:hypothetical protein